MIARMTTEVNRMGHMPQSPLWNAVEIEVSIETSPLDGLVTGLVAARCAKADPRHKTRQCLPLHDLVTTSPPAHLGTSRGKKLRCEPFAIGRKPARCATV